MLLSEFMEKSLNENYLMLEDYGYEDWEVEKGKNELKKIFILKGEDREIQLEDLKRNEGIIYNLLVEFCENEIMKELDLIFDMWEYSMESYIRDTFEDFNIEEIDEMVYFGIN